MDNLSLALRFAFQIYEDIIEGNLFQTLVCHRPRSLSVLNVRDETILAFIENDVEVQVCLIVWGF